MKWVHPLGRGTGVVMVTECAERSPNASWSSERGAFCSPGNSRHMPSRHSCLCINIPSFKNGLGVSRVIYTLGFQRAFHCECHRDSVTPKPTTGERAWGEVTKDDDRASRTHATSQEPFCWWRNNNYFKQSLGRKGKTAHTSQRLYVKILL